MTSTSLVISTYNREDALALCLESVVNQSLLPGEIVIADDGSRENTAALVKDFASRSKIPVQHIWQPDNGYQLARIRNKAFVASKGDYIVQIDGDLILHPEFISDHVRLAEKNIFTSGTRTMLDAELTGWLLSGKISPTDIHKYPTHITKKYNAVRNILLSKILFSLNSSSKNYKYVLGCNMAFWKKDLEKVNGYNEAITGWGKEDNELAVRLQNAGIKLRLIKHAAITWHLHHPTANLTSVPANEQILIKAIREKVVYVPQGYNSH
jgi:glycosyltransferase involved in cell wall biosynthesis